MSSTSEQGHPKNVAEFNQLITACQAMGSLYNPSNTSISITALQTVYQASDSALSAVNSSFPACKLVLTQRKEAFEPLSKISTRLISSLSAQGFPDNVLEDAKSFTRKIQGKKAKPTREPAPGEETQTQISSSQMSFDNRLGNLQRLIEYLTVLTGYAPNEPDLQLQSLNTLFTTLSTHNRTASTARFALVQARIARDTALYDPRAGLVQLAKMVKNYVKSAFGANSPQYLAIKGLTFTSPR
jgi:hypothetical protein